MVVGGQVPTRHRKTGETKESYLALNTKETPREPLEILSAPFFIDHVPTPMSPLTRLWQQVIRFKLPISPSSIQSHTFPGDLPCWADAMQKCPSEPLQQQQRTLDHLPSTPTPTIPSTYWSYFLTPFLFFLSWYFMSLSLTEGNREPISSH